MNTKKSIIEKYLTEFPNLPNQTLAKQIYNDNRLLFDNVEQVRTSVRYYRGAGGQGKLKKLTTDKFLSREKKIEKYNLPLSIETVYEPYKIICNNALIFADSHIPFHSISALETMFDYTHNDDIDAVIILGDLMDCFMVSYYRNDPTKIDFESEKNLTKKFLDELKRIYPKAKIYYKFGNHEKRFENYLIDHAPELFGLSEFRLEIILDLYNKQIEYIPEEVYIEMGNLFLLHGHEYKKAITSPANPARTYYLRTKSCAVGAHYHQTSEHTEPSINGDIATCWSIGCTSELHPKYMPLNKWNHGFARYKKEDDDFWQIENKRIIKNKVV